MTSIRHLGWTALALLAFAGCDIGTTSTPITPTPNVAPKPDAPPAPSPEAPKDKNDVKSIPVEPGKGDEPKGADAAKLSDDEIAEIKKLPEEDQKIALAQMTCPVSDEKLGEMGVPIKQVVDGKTFFLCCTGCEKAVKSDPAKVLAKLKK